MQIIRKLDRPFSLPPGGLVRILQIGATGFGNHLSVQLAGLGARIELEPELYSGIDHMILDPLYFGLCVIDCDKIGGLDLGRRAANIIMAETGRVPVILVSQACHRQEFPDHQARPVVLRGPVSTESVRLGYKHALRDRLNLRPS